MASGGVRKARSSRRAWPERAILVVHGIGVQAPYQVLRSFVAGLKGAGVRVQDTDIEIPSELGQPLPPKPTRISHQGTTADVYEVYWAPHASRQTTARSVLGWLLRLTFIPTAKMRWGTRKNWYDFTFFLGSVFAVVVLLVGGLVTLSNLTERAACPRPGQSPRITVLSEEEIARLCSQPHREAGAGETSLGLASWNFRELGAVVTVMWQSVPKTPSQFVERTTSDLTSAKALAVLRSLNLWEVFVLAAIVWVAAQILYRIWQLVGAGGTLRERAEGGLMTLGLVAAVLSITAVPLGPLVIVLLALIPTVLASVDYRLRHRASRISRIVAKGRDAVGMAQGRVLNRLNASILFLGAALFGLLIRMVEPVFVALALTLALMLAVLRTASSFMAESIGDIQVYMSRDPNSPHFKVREAVLAQLETVFGVVKERGYRSVVIVGHSLGSVVTMDGILRLRLRGSNLLDRIDTIVTVGSAVEKVRYFFSQEVELKGSDGSTADGAGQAEAEGSPESSAVRLEDLQDALKLASKKKWVNLWYWNDVVADPIAWYSGGELSNQPWKLVEDRLPEVLDESQRRLVANVSLGWRWIWPHSHYWRDPRVSKVIREAAFPALREAAPTANGPAARRSQPERAGSLTRQRR